MGYATPIIAEIGQEFNHDRMKKLALRKKVDDKNSLDDEVGGVSSVSGYGWWVVNSNAAANFYTVVNVAAWSNAIAATLVAASAAFALFAGAFWFPSKYKKPQISK